MKWLLLLLSLMALFVANNALFWLPGKYDWFNFVAAGLAILIAGVLAWFSSKRFAATTVGAHASSKNVVMAPPMAIYLFVLLIFLAGGC